ncbi:hypothetical protein HY463_00165 [Candidatus Peregrinibacteria bacterium]|nr:hypothetical protein [Candidatus Peregrinibacteria bacterium]
MVVLFVLLFCASWYAKKYIHTLPNPAISSELLKRVPARIREFALLGLLLTFFRDQDIPWFGMRFWTILLLVLMAFYAYKMRENYIKGMEVKLSISHKEQVLDKYLPRPKKKH